MSTIEAPIVTNHTPLSQERPEGMGFKRERLGIAAQEVGLIALGEERVPIYQRKVLAAIAALRSVRERASPSLN